MTDKSKVGDSGVASIIAGLEHVSSNLGSNFRRAYPARMEESVRFPELSEVKKTYDCPLMPAGTTAETIPFIMLTGTGRIISPLTKVA